jgi:hypothetical protein
MRPDELERRLRKQLNALGPAPRAELLHVLILPDYERVGGTRVIRGTRRPHLRRTAARRSEVSMLTEASVNESGPNGCSNTRRRHQWLCGGTNRCRRPWALRRDAERLRRLYPARPQLGSRSRRGSGRRGRYVVRIVATPRITPRVRGEGRPLQPTASRGTRAAPGTPQEAHHRGRQLHGRSWRRRLTGSDCMSGKIGVSKEELAAREEASLAFPGSALLLEEGCNEGEGWGFDRTATDAGPRYFS